MKTLKHGPNIPLSDVEILSASTGALIVLWAIREKGQISFSALFDMLCVNADASATESKGTALTGFARATRLLTAALTNLQQTGLIESTGGDLGDLEMARNAGNITAMIELR